MSALKYSNRSILVTLGLLAVVGGLWLIDRDVQPDEPAQIGEQAVTVELSSEQGNDASVDTLHGPDCAHCAHDTTVAVAEPRLLTNPEVDYIFKDFAKLTNKTIPLDTFDFLRGSQLDARARFFIGEQAYEGTIKLVRENHEHARSYGIDLDDELGKVLLSYDAGGHLKGRIFFYDDSRVLKIVNHRPEEGSAPSLLVGQTTVAQIVCATPDTIFTTSGFQSLSSMAMDGANLAQPAAPTNPISVPKLESHPDAEYVMFCNFEGEIVQGTDWNFLYGIDVIDALPQFRASDSDWVTLVWRRVVEDFAPFNINVTTDRAVYDAADNDKRLNVIITSNTQVTTSGVAFLYSFREDSPVAWAVYSEETWCASTISHEAGHAFGLEHDHEIGLEEPFDYYLGHNGSYEPGWAPIMGAFFGDFVYDEVDQWSWGEFANSANNEDDVSIIGDDSYPQLISDPDAVDLYGDMLLIENGFGFVADDIGDVISSPEVGTFVVSGPNEISASGVISTRTDVDVFSFTSDQGGVSIRISPLDVLSTYNNLGSETSGANLAVDARLVDHDGNLLALSVPDGQNKLGALIEYEVAGPNNAIPGSGTYYVMVEGGGRGDDAETGFSDYGSLGQYSIVGQLALPPLAVFGGEKQTESIFNASSTVQLANGTDFGFGVPDASISKSFIFQNTSSLTDITITSVRFASGEHFEVGGKAAPTGIMSPGTGLPFDLVYSPASAGVHTDTVIVEYMTSQPRVFEFTVGGTATASASSDNYEPNNSAFGEWPGGPYDLTNHEGTWLSQHLGLAFFKSDLLDWYAFNLEDGDELITLDTSYDASLGTVEFHLVKFNGEYLLSSSSGDATQYFRVPEEYTSAEHRKFFILVTTPDHASVLNAYDLKWSAMPLSNGDEDLYELENNDTLGTAYDLTGTPGTRLTEKLGPGRLNDEDWFKIEVPRDPFIRMLYVAVEFEHALGNIDLEVYDADLNVYRSATSNDREVMTYYDSVATEDYADSFDPSGNVSIMGVPPGTYYIRLYGDYNSNEYDLIVDTPRDDAYEVIDSEGTENDLRNNAYDLGESIIGKWLSEIDGIGTSSDYPANSTVSKFVNRADDDWFSFEVDPGEVITRLSLEFISFDGGFMFFELTDSTGKVLAQSNDSMFGSGTLEVDNPIGTTFYVHVVAENDIYALSGYDFRVSYTTDAVIEDAIEDNYEVNNTFQQLYDLSAYEGRFLSSVDGYGTQLDADWYQITVPANAAKLEATLFHVAAEGDLDLTLSKKDGPVHFVADSGGDLETITWENPIPGEYALTVTGEDAGNFYNLLWDITYSEDNYEVNNELDSAYDLTGFERRFLNKLDGPGIQKNEDWYRISVAADTVALNAEIRFSHADGDIDLSLHNAAGSMLTRSISTSDLETVSYTNPPAGDYYLRVYYENAGNEYDLTWSALSQAELDQVPDGDDVYEPNDTINNPYVLSESQSRLSFLAASLELEEGESSLGLQKNDDWYQIEVPADNVGLTVECLFTDAEGDIDIEVYDSQGYPLFIRDSITDNELLVVKTPIPAGTYTIRVYGPNLGNSYDLYWLVHTEDVYEENDTSAEAYDIARLLNSPLSENAIPTLTDPDWYKFDVSVTNPHVRVSLDYLEINGGVDFKILDSQFKALATVESTEDSERVIVPVDLPGVHYVQVYGDYAYNAYDLNVEVLSDDEYEDNDVSADATDLTDNNFIEASQFDDDWYSFTITETNEFLTIAATFTHADGNIDFAVYSSDDLTTAIRTAATEEDGEIVSFASEVGEYLIHVTGDDINQAYTLLWTTAPDDIYEQNDTQAEAANIVALEGETINGVQFDADWFEIYAAAGSLTINADLLYSSEGGNNLSIALYDSKGEELMLVDTPADNERLVYSLNPFVGVGSSYFIKVAGIGGGTTYELTWATSQEDAFEGDGGNNVFDDASADILESEGRRISDTIGYGGALDDDWYQVRINSGDDGIVVEAYFEHSESGNIDLELFKAVDANNDGEYTADEISLVKRSVGFSDVERIQYKGAAGDYLLRVFGASGENAYDLIWNSYQEDDLEIGVYTEKTPNNPPDNDSPDTPRSLRVPNLNETVRGERDLEFILLDGLTQLDEDWYLIEVEEGEDRFILDLQFEHAMGDIDVALYYRPKDKDEPLQLIEQAETLDDHERIELRDLVPGDYLICVYGYGIVNPKDADDWVPGSYDPSVDAEYGVISEDPDDGYDFYDLDDRHARGLANTYSLQWISSFEDEFDVETPEIGDIEVNDTFETTSVPALFDQYGVPAENNIIDSVPRTRTYTYLNDEGELKTATTQYPPVYVFEDLAQFDEDWYQFTVNDGPVHRFYASIVNFDFHDNLTLYLYDAEGKLLDQSSDNPNVLDIVTHNVTSAVGNTVYYVQVVGSDLGVPYDLEVTAATDDSYEENDDFSQENVGWDINEKEGRFADDYIARDDDYFYIDVPENQVHLYVWVRSFVRLTVEVFDENKNLLPSGFEISGRSDGANKSNYAYGVISPEGGRYYIRVSGGSNGTPYGMLWYYDNRDDYEGASYEDNNNIPENAEKINGNANLTRFRLEPVYDPRNGTYLEPIKEFGFDYDLLSGLTLGNPANDPFGHAVLEATGDDWYMIQVPSWFLATAKKGNKSVQVLKRDYYARLTAEIEFDHAKGDLNLEIYDETDLDTPLARSEISANYTPDAEEPNKYYESVAARIDPTDEALKYFIRVYGDNAAENSYSLKWDVTKDDAYEELEDADITNDTNNFIEQAYNLIEADGVSTAGTWLHDIEYLQDVNGDGVVDALDGGFKAPSGYGVQTNTDDWYTVLVSEGATQIEVECEFYSDNDTNYEYKPDNADIDFEVYYLAGNDGDDATRDVRKPVLIGRSASDTDTSLFAGTGEEANQLQADITVEILEGVATFDVPGAGIYFIRVYYDNRNHPYTLRWNDLGPTDDSFDADILDDYLNGDWSFALGDDLPPAILDEPEDAGAAIPNWLQFALGLNVDVTASEEQSIVEIDGKRYYQYEYLRNKEAEARGYRFIVEESENMLFDGSEAVFVGTESVSTYVEKAIYRCSQPLDEQGRCFFRLTVVEAVEK